MMLIKVLFLTVALSHTCLGGHKSFSDLPEALQEDIIALSAMKQQAPQIITKHGIRNTRNKKSLIRSPQGSEESSAKVNLNPERKGRMIRRRKARTNLKDISKVVSSAPVIEGVRMADDDTDKVIHRNGRFINNIFVGDEEDFPIPPEYTVRAAVGEAPKPLLRVRGQVKQLQRAGRSGFSQNERQPSRGRKIPFKYEFKDFYTGREQDMKDAMVMESRQSEVYSMPESRSSSSPVYFIAEDPGSLHADRSPYMFEPADTHSSQLQQPAVVSASNEDFVIKEHTYQMCPDCPSFSIPIPVPKSSASSSEVINPYNSDPGYKYQHQKEETIMERIMAMVQPALEAAKDTVEGFFAPETETNEITEKGFTDRVSSVSVPGKADVSPLMYAGMAAMGLGVATLLSSGLQIMSMGGVSVGRQFDTMDTLESENSVDNDVLEYNMSDILCMPRNYCEKLKRKKYMIDQYPQVKMVASMVAGMVFDKDTVQEKGESSVYNQCNLRECIFALIK